MRVDKFGLESPRDPSIKAARNLGRRRADLAHLLRMSVVQKILPHDGQFEIGRGAVGQTNIGRDVSRDRLDIVHVAELSVETEVPGEIIRGTQYELVRWSVQFYRPGATGRFSLHMQHQ